MTPWFAPVGAALRSEKLYIKNDAVMPTLSFKDRVSVALTRARELGFSTVSCASTGIWQILQLRSQLMPV